MQANGTKVLSPIIGYVPQTPRFDPQYPASVLDLFVACTTDHPVWLRPSKAVRNHVELALARVGMEDQIDKKVGVLSGGQLQRVLLALALEPLPQILLLDEPSTGVDAKGLKPFYSTVE